MTFGIFMVAAVSPVAPAAAGNARRDGKQRKELGDGEVSTAVGAVHA
jgi:hypothetical protein